MVERDKTENARVFSRVTLSRIVMMVAKCVVNLLDFACDSRFEVRERERNSFVVFLRSLLSYNVSTFHLPRITSS
jgi:hypothetical protein